MTAEWVSQLIGLQKNTKNPIGLLPSLLIQRFWSYKGGEFLKGISIFVQSRKLNQISSPPIFNLGIMEKNLGKWFGYFFFEIAPNWK